MEGQDNLAAPCALSLCCLLAGLRGDVAGARMITSKTTRCQRWTWAYITRYPGIATRSLQGATVDYSEHEIGQALVALARLGYVEQDCQRLWQPVVPFVVVVPAWVK